MNNIPDSPSIDTAALRARFLPLQSWEEKYRQLILLGKTLPPLTDEQRAMATEVRGCENRVWLGVNQDKQGKFWFYGDSEGRIVRGLLAVLMVAINGKTSTELSTEDPLALFHELGLSAQLSASRGQGLTAMAAAVKTLAQRG